MSPRAGAMTAIIRDLTDGSAFLSNQKNQIFNIWKILEAPGVEVIDFYDTRDTKTVELDFPLLWLVEPEKCRIREAVNSYIISDKVPAEESIFYCQWYALIKGRSLTAAFVTDILFQILGFSLLPPEEIISQFLRALCIGMLSSTKEPLLSLCKDDSSPTQS